MNELRQLAIIGTTASGKSALAIELASKFNGVILSLDSLALYKEIDIASAKPSKAELASVPHFGVDIINPDEDFSAGQFFDVYSKAAEFARKNGRILFITGGSGFYLNAMLKGLSPAVPKIDTASMPALDEIYQKAHEIDPVWADKFSPNDKYRLWRWWEIYAHTGMAASEFLAKNTSAPLISKLDIFEIAWQRDELRSRIAHRTAQMIDAGLIDEAKMLFSKYSADLKSLNSIGLKECGQYLRAEVKTKDELKELITIHTAQLAKRQRTFNKSQFINRFSGNIKECQKAINSCINKDILD